MSWEEAGKKGAGIKGERGRGEGGRGNGEGGEDFSDWEPAVRNWGKNFPMGNETPLFNSINVSLSNE